VVSGRFDRALPRRWLERGFLALGLLFLALWFKSSIDSRKFQSIEGNRLETALREAESERSETSASYAAFVDVPASDPPKPATEERGVLGRIEIPRLHISAIVAEGSDVKTLKRAVGHIPSTALPGAPGNCALAGHRDSFLRGLGGARVNDLIRIVTLEQTYIYQVEWCVVVEPQRVDVLDSTATRSLTLVTCYPFAFVGPAPQRFVVRARQVEAVAGRLEIPATPPIQTHGPTAEGR
jgi:LPXTG-site transpeptidase (sortase) family protein